MIYMAAILNFATKDVSYKEERMRLEYFGKTDVGRKREKNEDSLLLNGKLNLYMVADGMGGHVGGGFASRLAVQTVEEAVIQSRPESLEPEDCKALLQHAVGMASRRIFEKAASEVNLQGMGTTAVALFFRKNKVYIGNVGDSRAYRIRSNKLEQMTVDHSLVGEQLRAGILKPKEAKEHRLKNIITRSVGFQSNVEVDSEVRMAKPGDFYLLCSDGLYNLVEDEEMLDVVTHQNLQNACQQLIDIANSRGGDDNITVVLVKVISLEEEEIGEEESTLQC